MSTKDLEEYVSNDLFNYFDKLGEHEFLEEARNYWDYPVTREGIYQACYDEVVAEATDTGDLPMYGQAMLNQSAQWKFDDFMADIEKMVGVK